jgi:hypothetical protein
MSMGTPQFGRSHTSRANAPSDTHRTKPCSQAAHNRNMFGLQGVYMCRYGRVRLGFEMRKQSFMWIIGIDDV